MVVYKSDCQLEIHEIASIGHNAQYTFIADTLAAGERILGTNALLVFEELNQN